MRTTVSLDDDVLAELRRVAAESGVTVSDALNSALRRGLESVSSPVRKGKELPIIDLGLRQGIDLDKAHALAYELDDAERIQKLAWRT